MATDKLSDYKAKRDFALTREPRGQAEASPSTRRRFVVQKHDATRLHYDLRLELNGVFKSWAVTRGPSLDPHDKRLAVEVEDHPLDYGDFEGTIPKGQYGGGTVMLWDRGYWEPNGKQSPEQALANGDFKFRLNGKRLHGGFVLVRMAHDRGRGKRTNWLLIKHRDDFSVDQNGASVLEENDTSVASGRAMAAIAIGKGRKPKPFMLQEGRSRPMRFGTAARALRLRSARRWLGEIKNATPSLSALRQNSFRRSFATPWTGRRRETGGSTRSSSMATGSRRGCSTARFR